MTLGEQAALRALLVSSIHTAKEASALVPADHQELSGSISESLMALYEALEDLAKLTVYDPKPASKPASKREK